MITFFTIPKPFRGHVGVIQRNAIQSWLKLSPKCEILLLGDETGLRETAREFDTVHINNINKTDYGTPLLDHAFKLAQETASNGIICYINSDIILLDDFLPAVRQIEFERFLMAGQRWDLDLRSPCSFRSGWEEELRREVIERGVLHPPSGKDYFAFSKGAMGPMPPFAVGRQGWDNWLIYDFRSRGIPVIDATQRVMAVHQNHDYNHVPSKTGARWEGPESDRNLELIGKNIYEWNIEDADWTLGDCGPVRKALSPREVFRRLTMALPPVAHAPLEEFFLWQHRRKYGADLRRRGMPKK